MDETRDHERAQVADYLTERIALQAMNRILDENRRVHVLEDRVVRLERRLRQLGIDPTIRLMAPGNRPIDIVRGGSPVQGIVA